MATGIATADTASVTGGRRADWPRTCFRSGPIAQSAATRKGSDADKMLTSNMDELKKPSELAPCRWEDRNTKRSDTGIANRVVAIGFRASTYQIKLCWRWNAGSGLSNEIPSVVRSNETGSDECPR